MRVRFYFPRKDHFSFEFRVDKQGTTCPRSIQGNLIWFGRKHLLFFERRVDEWMRVGSMMIPGLNENQILFSEERPLFLRVQGRQARNHLPQEHTGQSHLVWVETPAILRAKDR